MNCKKCNATLQDTDIICPNCGENVDNSVLKNHEASTVKSEEMKKLTKGDKTEEKEMNKKKFKEIKKKIIIAASIVLCVLIVFSASLISVTISADLSKKAFKDFLVSAVSEIVSATISQAP